MSKRIRLIVLVAILHGYSLPSSLAQEEPNLTSNSTSKTGEHVGFGSGLVIGASVGGPFGAVIGASLGAVFGDYYDNNQDTQDQLRMLGEEYAQSKVLESKLNRQLQKMRTELLLVEHEAEQLEGRLQDLLAERAVFSGLEFAIHFATDEAEIESDDIGKIAALADLLKSNPRLAVQVRGYADQRGSDSYNQTLSLDRAFAVADLLESLGVDSTQMRTFAFGETESAESTLPTYYQDRRVDLLVSTINELHPVVEGDEPHQSAQIALVR